MIENTIRLLAIGRKNYLFAGSHQAVRGYAMTYSFFATCKTNNIDLYKWLVFVLNNIQKHKINKLYQILPQNWKS